LLDVALDIERGLSGRLGGDHGFLTDTKGGQRGGDRVGAEKV